MIRFALALVLFASSSAFAAPSPTWSKKMVEDLKTKTLQQTFCDNSPGFQTKAVCDYFGKDKSEFSKKLISVNLQGNVLTLGDGKRTVEIKRLKDELQFEVNRKVIDMRDLREPAKLAKALQNALPKVATRSLWMNSAYAEDDINSPTYSLMVKASASVLALAIDDSTCEATADFINACSANLDNEAELPDVAIGIAKLKKGEALDKEEKRNFESKLETLSLKVYRMKLVTYGLIERVRNANTYCQAKGWENVSAHMDKCLVELKNTAENLKRLTCASTGVDQKTCEETTIAFGRKLDMDEERKIAPKATSKSKETKHVQ